MGKTVFDISMSLDGFITASNQTADEPLGQGGEEHLHKWAFSTEATNQRFIEQAVNDLGAYICGRRTYDHSVPWWGADGPSGSIRRPVIVVTHEAPTQPPADSVYQFVTGGIESALKQAHEAAGDKDVAIMGGADLGRQYLAAGLVDELSIHVVPVLFGTGTRMFEDLGRGHVRLSAVDVLATPSATHLRYRIVT